MENKTNPMEYIDSIKFLTLIIPVDENDPLQTEHLSNGSRKKLITRDSGLPESPAVIGYGGGLYITVFCEDNYRTPKNVFKKCATVNVRATKIANSLDKMCNHCIQGECAFVFDDDNEASRGAISRIKSII